MKCNEVCFIHNPVIIVDLIIPSTCFVHLIMFYLILVRLFEQAWYQDVRIIWAPTYRRLRSIPYTELTRGVLVFSNIFGQ